MVHSYGCSPPHPIPDLLGHKFGFWEDHNTMPALPSLWCRVSAKPQVSWVGSAGTQPCIQTAESALKHGSRGFPALLRNLMSAGKNDGKSANPILWLSWALPAVLQCPQVPGDWWQACINLSVITIYHFFLLLKLLLCEFLCPAHTAGPTFPFAREHRVAVFIGNGVKKKNILATQSPSLPLVLCGFYLCDYLFPWEGSGRFPAHLRQRCRQEGVSGDLHRVWGMWQQEGSRFGSPAGGTARGQGHQRHRLAWLSARGQPDHLHLWKAHLWKVYPWKAQLQKAHLQKVYLQKVHLRKAHLQKVYLQKAHLQKAHLQKAHLQKAHLQKHISTIPCWEWTAGVSLSLWRRLCYKMPPTKAILAAQVRSWGLHSDVQNGSFSFANNTALKSPCSPCFAPPPASLKHFQAREAAQVFCLVKPFVPHFVFPRRLWKSIPGEVQAPWASCLPCHGGYWSQMAKSQQSIEKKKGPNNLLVMTLLTTSLGVVNLLVSFLALWKGCWLHPWEVVALGERQGCLLLSPAGQGTCRIWALEATRCQGYSVTAVTAARCGIAGLA